MSSQIVGTSPNKRYVKFGEILGSGAYKKVFFGMDVNLGIEVAWNEVRMDSHLQYHRSNQNKSDIDQYEKKILREVDILVSLKHPKLIQIFDCWIEDKRSANTEDQNYGYDEEAGKTLVFITEHMNSGTLKQYLATHKKVTLKVIKSWSVQLLEGLCYLHSLNIIHRDLKCDNIFINGNSSELKIADLGLATVTTERHPSRPLSVIGTPEFMAPEFYEEDYDELVDIWAFGMCFIEMCTREYPFQECQNHAQIFKLVVSGQMPSVLYRIQEDEIRDFIKLTLLPRSSRPSAQQLIQNPFLLSQDDPISSKPVDIIPLTTETTTSKNSSKRKDIFSFEPKTLDKMREDHKNEIQRERQRQIEFENGEEGREKEQQREREKILYSEEDSHSNSQGSVDGSSDDDDDDDDGDDDNGGEEYDCDLDHRIGGGAINNNRSNGGEISSITSSSSSSSSGCRSDTNKVKRHDHPHPHSPQNDLDQDKERIKNPHGQEIQLDTETQSEIDPERESEKEKEVQKWYAELGCKDLSEDVWKDFDKEEKEMIARLAERQREEKSSLLYRQERERERIEKDELKNIEKGELRKRSWIKAIYPNNFTISLYNNNNNNNNQQQQQQQQSPQPPLEEEAIQNQQPNNNDSNSNITSKCNSDSNNSHSHIYNQNHSSHSSSSSSSSSSSYQNSNDSGNQNNIIRSENNNTNTNNINRINNNFNTNNNNSSRNSNNNNNNNNNISNNTFGDERVKENHERAPLYNVNSSSHQNSYQLSENLLLNSNDINWKQFDLIKRSSNSNLIFSQDQIQNQLQNQNLNLNLNQNQTQTSDTTSELFDFFSTLNSDSASLLPPPLIPSPLSPSHSIVDIQINNSSSEPLSNYLDPSREQLQSSLSSYPFPFPSNSSMTLPSSLPMYYELVNNQNFPIRTKHNTHLSSHKKVTAINSDSNTILKRSRDNVLNKSSEGFKTLNSKNANTDTNNNNINSLNRTPDSIERLWLQSLQNFNQDSMKN